jgi:hypothetical protein
MARKKDGLPGESLDLGSAPATAVAPRPKPMTSVESVEDQEARIKALGGNLARRIVSLVQTAGVKVVDIVSCQAAVNVRDDIDALDKEAEEYFKPEKAYYFKLHRAATAREGEVRKPLADLRKKIQTAIKEFNDAATIARQAEENRLAEAVAARNLLAAKDEAERTTAAGSPEVGAMILTTAEHAAKPTVALPDVASQVDGLKFKEVWHWRYVGGPNDVEQTSLDVLDRAKAMMPDAFKMVDESKIDALVKKLGPAAKGLIPMVDIYMTQEPK